MRRTWPRPALWAVALVAGTVYGIAGTIGQAFVWGVLPIGLIVASLGVTALIFGIRLLSGDRWAALAAGMGAMIATLVFSGRGPGGSVVVPAPVDAQISTGIVWTFVVPLVVAVVVAWPSRPAARPVDTN